MAFHFAPRLVARVLHRLLYRAHFSISVMPFDLKPTPFPPERSGFPQQREMFETGTDRGVHLKPCAAVKEDVATLRKVSEVHQMLYLRTYLQSQVRFFDEFTRSE